MSDPKTRLHSGFTIVEALIAIAVLGAVIGGLVALQASALRIGSSSRAESDAQQVAIVAFERLKVDVQEAAAFAARVGCPALGSAASAPCVRVFDEPPYRITERIAGYTASGQGLLTVQVVVDGPRLTAPFEFRQLLSCLDTVPSPTLGAPGLCAAPGATSGEWPPGEGAGG